MKRLTNTVILCSVAGAFLTAALAGPLEAGRTRLYQALLAGKVLNPDRSVMHFSHTCSLAIEGKEYPVVDLREVTKTETTAHGVNTIVVMSPLLKVLHKIDYATERPLDCVDNKLYVFGDLTIDGVEGRGNVLTFRDRAETIIIENVDVTKWPLTPTKDRLKPPQ